jgi:hypothetical protein
MSFIITIFYFCQKSQKIKKVKQIKKEKESKKFMNKSKHKKKNDLNIKTN